MTAVNLFYSELGTANAEPLIILHGFFASSRNWRQIAEKLSAEFHVFILDMRNHGLSPHDEVMDYPTMSDDLRHFIDQHELETINLLGHSMGGKVAMWFALNHSERVKRLIIADIAPVSYSHGFNDIIQALKSVPLSEISNRKQAETWLADFIPELSYRQFLLQNLVLSDSKYHWRINLDIFSETAPNIAAFPNTEHLPPYAGNTLFIVGAESNFVKEADIKKLFPRADLVTISGAGHWLHVQQPQIFIEKVGKFLKF